MARWRATNRSPRFDKTTGQPRKRWSLRDTRGIAAVVALALVVGSGLAVVSVSSAAEAHTPSIKVTCEGVTVTGKYYERSGSRQGQHNLIKFQLEGGELQVVPFSKNATQFFAFPNSTEPHTFTASVTAWNNPTHPRWNASWTKTSEACDAQSIVEVTAPRCEVPGGSTDITATFKGLVAGRNYDVTINGGSMNSVTSTYTPTQTTGSYTWEGTAAGPSYTVTITDTENRSLTASKTVDSVPCPDQSGIEILPCECTVPGEGASLKVKLSGLVNGREYRINIVNATSDAVIDSHTFTANSTTGAYNSRATPSASYYATVVDTSQSNATPLKSNTHTFLPCPEELVKPVLTATQCDAVSTEAQGGIGVVVNSLVPGRAYTVVVRDSAGNEVFAQKNHVATTDRFETKLTDLAPGAYTATVRDVKVPSFTQEASIELLACATNDTTVELTANQCTVPGGAASITATVSNFTVGRDYSVALMLNNVIVGSAQTLDSSSATPKEITFDGLTPGNTYRVVVTDTKASPAVTSAADLQLVPCPGNPIVMITAAECNVLGASTIGVATSDLVLGQEYTVSVVSKSTGEPVAGASPVTFTADLPTRSLEFAEMPNGATYTVSIVNTDKSLSATDEITLVECDLPTFPLPPENPPVVPPTDVPPTLELPTLAYTGSSTMVPTLAGLGFLQLGLMLVGFSVARRRSVVRSS